MCARSHGGRYAENPTGIRPGFSTSDWGVEPDGSAVTDSTGAALWSTPSTTIPAILETLRVTIKAACDWPILGGSRMSHPGAGEGSSVTGPAGALHWSGRPFPGGARAGSGHSAGRCRSGLRRPAAGHRPIEEGSGVRFSYRDVRACRMVGSAVGSPGAVGVAGTSPVRRGRRSGE